MPERAAADMVRASIRKFAAKLGKKPIGLFVSHRCLARLREEFGAGPNERVYVEGVRIETSPEE